MPAVGHDFTAVISAEEPSEECTTLTEKEMTVLLCKQSKNKNVKYSNFICIIFFILWHDINNSKRLYIKGLFSFFLLRVKLYTFPA